MKRKNYSKEIADAINNFLVQDDWHFSFDENCGIFRFNLGLKGKLKKINYVVDVKDDEYLVLATSPLGAEEENVQMMANMAEFICRANYGLKMGNFEFDYNDGEIRFKVHICCEDVIPTTSIIRRSIYCPATMFDRYSSGIVDIIFNDASGKAAVEKCEKHDESRFYSILSELLGEETATAVLNDEDPEATAAQLIEQMSIMANEEDTDQENDDTDDDDLIIDLFETEGETEE
ncbi:MAG: hypothetical protein IKL00_10785 [Oscillospiraceae bacterium]|nr:hypothetical protein [Oscillospiraceae bacterium]